MRSGEMEELLDQFEDQRESRVLKHSASYENWLLWSLSAQYEVTSERMLMPLVRFLILRAILSFLKAFLFVKL
ncbi:hypothetical protein RB195_007015 [Necator americanus]|uniref:Uncharacterized protein n=1 Tax=Necator americanus TaxID=51031 RepID=A0ABR1BV91_NECAM